MTIAEPSEHEIGGLGTEGEYRLSTFEGRSQLRESQPDGRRSRVSQTIRRDDDPLTRDAERRRQNGIDATIGLMRQDVVGRMACSALRRCRAMQKQFKARITYRGEIVPKLGKSETAARGIGAAIRYCQAGQAPAPQLAVKHVRESRAWTVVIAREDYSGCAVAHLDEIDELTASFAARCGSKNTEPVSDPTIATGPAPARSNPCANTRALAKPVQAWRNSTKGPS